MKRTLYIVLGAIVAVFVAAVLITASIWPVINAVETGRTPQYPEVQPQYYTAEPARIFDETRAGIEALDDFTLTTTDPATFKLEAEHHGLLGLTSDIAITIQPVTEFVTQVNIRSASRIGRGDLGQNARNIRALFTELDHRLGAVKLDANQLNGSTEESTDNAEAPEESE